MRTLRLSIVLRLTLFLLFFSSMTYGQFEGSEGSGHAQFQLDNSFCNHFFGDIASGYNSNHDPNLSNCTLFYGDSSSGYSTQAIATGGSCSNFFGSDFSGAQSEHFQNPLGDCFLFTESVNGASGHNSRSYTADNDDICAFIVLGIEGSPLFGDLLDDETARLYWETYSERSNAGFEMQRSLDGVNWSAIGWIPGQGNSTELHQYEFFDVDLVQEGQYYRFKQLDFDGKISYSNTVFLSLKNPTSLKEIFALYPNPSSQFTSLKLKAWVKREWQVQLTVIDVAGRNLFVDTHVFDQGQELFEFPANQFVPGTYYLIVQPERTKERLQIPFVVN